MIVYDVAAMLIIYYRALQKKPDEEFGQIFIDEAQDFGPIVYYALRTVLPECFFTIMGDVSQNVNYEYGMNDWRDMTQKIFHSKEDAFHVLAKSYRNTIEISDFRRKKYCAAHRKEPIRSSRLFDMESLCTFWKVYRVRRQQASVWKPFKR